MTFDLINDIHNWKPTGAFYSKVNPNRLWFQFWKQKRIEMEILEKQEGDMLLRVGYFNDGCHVICESLSEWPSEPEF